MITYKVDQIVMHSDKTYGRLVLSFNLKSASSIKKIKFLLASIELLKNGDTFLIPKVDGCIRDFFFNENKRREFSFLVEPGKYTHIRFHFSKIWIYEANDWEVLTDNYELNIKRKFLIQPKKITLTEFKIDPSELRGNPKHLKSIVKPSIKKKKFSEKYEKKRRLSKPSKVERKEFNFSVKRIYKGFNGKVRIQLSTSGVTEATDFQYAQIDPKSRPDLANNYLLLGPIIEINSKNYAADTYEVTIPYYERTLIQKGISPEDLVLIREQGDEFNLVYPLKVDKETGELTVRLSGSATFLVSTALIQISKPEIHQIGGALIAYTYRPEITIWGRVADHDARVVISNHTGGWSQNGWFVYENIPLPLRGDNQLELVAERNGTVLQRTALTIKKAAPPKRVTRSTVLYGPTLKVDIHNLPIIGLTVEFTGWRTSNNPEPFPTIHSWLRQFSQNLPFIYWHNIVDRDFNRWSLKGALLPELYFENLAALACIRAINEIPNSPFERIDVSGDFPEETRYLHSLNAFILTVTEQGITSEDSNIQQLLDSNSRPTFLNENSRSLGAGHITISPNISIVSEGSEWMASFVAASESGFEKSSSSKMRILFVYQYFPFLSRNLEDGLTKRDELSVHIGKLFYTVVTPGNPGGEIQREVVADNIWCSRVEMKSHPSSGNPVILAIGWLEDEDDLMRTELLLFEREAEGVWRRESISTDLPIVDADFEFDQEGKIRVVASASISNRPTAAKIANNFYEFLKNEDGWQSELIVWTARSFSNMEDTGNFPRLKIDGQGRSVIAFTSQIEPSINYVDSNSITHMVAVKDNGDWLAEYLQVTDMRALTGSRNSDAYRNYGHYVLGQSRVGYLGWAPSIEMDNDGKLLYTFGNGALNMITVDTGSLVRYARNQRIDERTFELDRRFVDVDASLGFYASMVVKRDGHLAIAYKDGFVTDARGDSFDSVRISDQTLYFSSEFDNWVPNLQAQSRPISTSPFHFIGGPTVIANFGYPHQELDRGIFSAFNNTFESILPSLLRDRKFHVNTIMPGGTKVFWNVRPLRPLNLMLNGLRTNPTATHFTIDNTDFPNEEIQEIRIIIYSPLVIVPGLHYEEDFKNGIVPAQFYNYLLYNGFTLSNRRVLNITPWEDDKNLWILEDPDPFNFRIIVFPSTSESEPPRNPLPLRYKIRKLENENAFEVSIDPIVIVKDRDGLTDLDGNPTPAGITYFFLLEYAGEMIGDFAGAFPNLNLDLQEALAHNIEIRDVKLVSVTPVSETGAAQGAFRFSWEVPYLQLKGIYPPLGNAEFRAYSKQKSSFTLDIAPYISNDRNIDNDRRLSWWYRSSGWQLGEIEADILSWGSFDLVKAIASFIPIIGPAAILSVNHIAENKAEGRITEFNQTPALGGFNDLVLSTFAKFFEENLPGEFDAVFLQNWLINGWRRITPTLYSGESYLSTLPGQLLNFGQHIIGNEPIQKQFIIVVDTLPVQLLEISFEEPTVEFNIVTHHDLPFVIENSVIVRLSFEGRSSAGFRQNAIVLRYNENRTKKLTLVGVVRDSPQPEIFINPSERIHFGVGIAGQELSKNLSIQNLGNADLVISALQIDSDISGQSYFYHNPTLPLIISSQDNLSIPFFFAPDENAPLPSRASLRISSNDPDSPENVLELIGYYVQPELYVHPPSVIFGPSPIANDIPAGVEIAQLITIANLGGASLTILGSSFEIVDSTASTSPDFLLLDNNNNPLPKNDSVLRPGEQFQMKVVCQPVRAVAVFASIFLQVDSGTGSTAVLELPIQGEGVDWPGELVNFQAFDEGVSLPPLFQHRGNTFNCNNPNNVQRIVRINSADELGLQICGEGLKVTLKDVSSRVDVTIVSYNGSNPIEVAAVDIRGRTVASDTISTVPQGVLQRIVLRGIDINTLNITGGAGEGVLVEFRLYPKISKIT